MSRILGQLRSTLFAALLGTGTMSDIFYLAFKIPNLFRRIFAEGAMNSVFIPIFNQLNNHSNNHPTHQLNHEKTGGGEKEGNAQNGFQNNYQNAHVSENDFYSLIFSTLLITLLVFCCFTIFWAEEIIRLLFYFKESATQVEIRKATLLLQIMIPYLALVSVAALCQSVLQSKKIFSVSAFAPVLFNLVLISSAVGMLFMDEEVTRDIIFRSHFYLLGDREYFPAVILSVSVVVGGLAQLVYSNIRVSSLKFYWQPLVFFRLYRHPLLKKFFILLTPIIFTSGIYQINVLLVDPLTLALEPGSISFLFISNRLLELPLGLFGVSIATVSLPLLSQNSFSEVGKDGIERVSEEFLKIMRRTINLLFLLIPPILVISLLFSREIVSILFQYGKFDDRSVVRTAECFVMHILAVPAIFLYRFQNNIFFANNDTFTPFLAAVISLVVSLGMTILLLQFSPEASSVALASTIASYAILAYLTYKINKKLGVSIIGLLWKHTFFYLKITILPLTIAIILNYGLNYGINSLLKSNPFDFSFDFFLFNPRELIDRTGIWGWKALLFLKLTLVSALFLVSYLFLLYRLGEVETSTVINRLLNNKLLKK